MPVPVVKAWARRFLPPAAPVALVAEPEAASAAGVAASAETGAATAAGFAAAEEVMKVDSADTAVFAAAVD